MKKAGIILGIVILALILIMIIVPIAFKPQIVKMIREKASQNINAIVDFEDISLSLLSNFPNAGLEIDKLSIVNREPFPGDTLIYVEKFKGSLSLSKLLFGKQAVILGLSIEKPRIMLQKMADGSANWNIMPETPPTPASTTESSAMQMAVKHYEINDAYIAYLDDSSKVYAQVVGLNHSGSGDFQQQQFTLETKTKIDELSVNMAGISYMNKAELEVKADLDIDMAQGKYTFKENEIRLNQLFLNFNGWVQMAGENINMDMTFSAPKTEFRNILSMIPAVYSKDFGEIKADGQLTLQGKLQGTYNKTQMPLTDIRLIVDNGSFQYPKLQASAKNIGIDLQIQNPGRTTNDTEIDLRRFHVEILNEPVDAQLLIKTPISDPYIDGYLKGTINLTNLGKLVPLGDSTQLAGLIKSDVTFRGNLSALQNKNVSQFSAAGNVAISDLKYASPALPEAIEVKTANLAFTPQKANLSNFNMMMGKSDIEAQGGLDNIFGYIFGDQTLTGTLAVSSSYLNLNPIMEAPGGGLAAIELPAKIEFAMTGNFNEVIITNMVMKNVRGKLLLKDQTLTMTDISANIVEGNMLVNGFYRYIKPAKPHVDFDIKLTELSIPAMYKTFVTVQQFAPMAGYMQGQVDGNLNMSTDLGDSLLPLWQTIISNGDLKITQAKLDNFPPINKLADALKLEQLRNPGISNFNPAYNIKDGFFNIKPVDFKIGDYQVIASGGNGLDKSLDYLLKLQIPAGSLKNSANDAISGLIKKDVTLLTNETVVIDANVKGSVQNPSITTSLNQIAKGAAEQIKQQALQQVEEKKQELQNQAQEKLQEQTGQTGDSLKQEIEKQKEEQKEKVKDKLKGLFGR